MRLRFDYDFPVRIESKKWNDNAARYGCDESGGKENVEMSCLSSRPYEIIDFFINTRDTKFLFIFGFKILKVGLVDFAYAMFVHFDKSAWDVQRERDIYSGRQR